MLLFYSFLCFFFYFVSNHCQNEEFYCQNPKVGDNLDDKRRQRRFLIVGGIGGGIGNYLIFFPSAFYYAALTGREILIDDNSLIGEACQIITCGYPLFNDAAKSLQHLEAFQSFQHDNRIPYLKAFDFIQHFQGGRNISYPMVRADGYKDQSGWYKDLYYSHEFVNNCLRSITGCNDGDIRCHDRHAYQQLVRGPFRSSDKLHKRLNDDMISMPENIKQALLTMQHEYIPHFDGGLHLRCQFQHFEWLVGEDDLLWPKYRLEIQSFMNSTADDLFTVLENKLLEEFPRMNQQSSRQEELGNYNDSKLHIYVASDNEVVKEAFAQRLFNKYSNTTSIIRIHINESTSHVVHSKNLAYVRDSNNHTGMIDLVIDWYALSLSNKIFAWRRDTSLTSTFVHSSRRFSNKNASKDHNNRIASHGFQLNFHGGSRFDWKGFS